MPEYDKNVSKYDGRYYNDEAWDEDPKNKDGFDQELNKEIS